MKITAQYAALITVFATLAGCVGQSASPAPASAVAETIAVSVGPCFGFCPVYTLSVTDRGSVHFEGERHTAQLGVQTREAGPANYAKVAQALAPYRPATGTSAQTQCDTRISDQQSYQIQWQGTGGQVTTLTHDKGCRSAANDRLNEALQELPATLGADGWTKQTTRPGASRG